MYKLDKYFLSNEKKGNKPYDDTSNSVVCSTTEDEPKNNNGTEIEESIDENEATSGQFPLHEAQMELQYFPEIEEPNNDDDISLDLSNGDENDFLTQAIQNVTTLANDISENKNKINIIQANSEVIENELKIKNIQSTAIEMKIDCLDLFLESTLKEFENLPNDENLELTDEEINKLL